jgi:phosphatidylglycerophosphate synthase
LRERTLAAVVPNLLTTARAGLGIWLLIGVARDYWLVLVLACALSDFLDGLLARRWAVASPTGAAFDLAADGLLFLAFIVAFWREGLWPAWLCVGILLSGGLQALAQFVFWERGGSFGSPGRYWNRIVGGYSYASVTAVSAGMAPQTLGLVHLAVAWWAHSMDLRLALKSPAGQRSADEGCDAKGTM